MKDCACESLGLQGADASPRCAALVQAACMCQAALHVGSYTAAHLNVDSMLRGCLPSSAVSWLIVVTWTGGAIKQ